MGWGEYFQVIKSKVNKVSNLTPPTGKTFGEHFVVRSGYLVTFFSSQPASQIVSFEKINKLHTHTHTHTHTQRSALISTVYCDDCNVMTLAAYQGVKLSMTQFSEISVMMNVAISFLFLCFTGNSSLLLFPSAI